MKDKNTQIVLVITAVLAFLTVEAIDYAVRTFLPPASIPFLIKMAIVALTSICVIYLYRRIETSSS